MGLNNKKSLFLFLLFSSFWLYLEIRDFWRPGAGLAGMRDSMAQIWDIPGNPVWVATLVGLASENEATYTPNIAWELSVC